jgi:aromatic-L-amino-acid decarboxylase
MDYSFQLGRRFRALKLWFVMRSYGRQGVAGIIESHCEMANDFARRLLADGRFEIAAPIEFSLVCFRYRGTDEENRRLIEAINATGRAFLSHTVVDGRYILRMAVGNWQTTPEDIARLAALITGLV